MKNLLNEYLMVKKRVEKVSNYNYTVDLKAKLAEAKLDVKQNKKSIKDMEMDQKRRDIQMNWLVNSEKTDAMRRVDYNHQKLTYMQEKIVDVQNKIDGLEVIKEEQDENYQEIKERYDKLVQIGQSYGIKLDSQGHVVTSKKAANLKKKFEEAKKQERAVRSEIESLEKHSKMEAKDKKKQLRSLTNKKNQTGKAILEKIADIRGKALELAEVIEMKSYDIGEDLLEKWKKENERTLQKLEEDEKNALDVNHEM